MMNQEDMNVQLEEEEMLEMDKVSTLFWMNKNKNFIVVQISPAARVAMGEYFGLSRGEDGIGKIASVLRELGADAVVDTAIAEDAVAILETKNLLAHKKNNNAPLFASRCTAFTRMVKEKYPSVCVSDLPATATVAGNLLRKFYSEQTGKRVFVIAVEPCRVHKTLSGVDLVLTTEELVSILAETEINVRLEKKSALDVPFGASSGSAYICATSGGVADSVARCLSADKSQDALRKFAYSGLYGTKKLREAVLTIDGKVWKFAVVCGLAAAEELLQRVEKGEVDYDYVEVMACGGGCVGGDGQACVIGEDEKVEQVVKLRAQGLKYIESKRAAKAADMSASATMLARAWTDLVRNGDVQNESIDWDALFDEVAVDFISENAEIVEDFVDDVVAEETVEEVATEEVVVEEVEEVAEEVIETVVETVIEEEAVEEIVEEAVEMETVVEEEIAVAEEVVEETVEVVEEVAEIVEEEAEEIAETTEEAEVADKKDPYYTRLSGRDRRKMKRKKKNNK